MKFQVAHRQGGAAGVPRRGRRVGEVPERSRRLRAELLPGQGGGQVAGRRRSQDIPQRLHQSK